MATRIPVLDLLHIHKPDIRLMHQGRGLQSLARFLVDEFGGVRITVLYLG